MASRLSASEWMSAAATGKRLRPFRNSQKVGEKCANNKGPSGGRADTLSRPLWPTQLRTRLSAMAYQEPDGMGYTGEPPPGWGKGAVHPEANAIANFLKEKGWLIDERRKGNTMEMFEKAKNMPKAKLEIRPRRSSSRR